MAWSLPHLMQPQAERSIAFHSGTESGIGSAENSKVKLAATIELYAYWNRLRGARSAPERNDVDPGAIRGVLADTFVLDFDARRGFPFRIAGSRANALFLKELRGFSFLDLWAAPIAKNSIRFFIVSPTRRRHSLSAPRPGCPILTQQTSRSCSCPSVTMGCPMPASSPA